MSIRSEVLLWAQRVIAKKGAPAHQLLDIKPDAEMDEAQAAFHKIARMAHPDLHRNSLAPEDLEVITTAYARIAAAYQELRNARVQTQRIRPLQPDPPPPRPVSQPPPLLSSRPVTQPPPLLSSRPVTQPPPVASRPVTQPPPVASRPVTLPPPLASRPVTQPPPLASRPVTLPPPLASRPVTLPPPLSSRPVTQPPPLSSRPVTQPPPLSSRPVTLPPPLASRPVTQPPPLDPSAPPIDPPPPPPPPASSAVVAASAMSSKALVHYRKAELCLRRGELKGAVLQLKMAIACDPQSAFLRTALAEVEAEVSK